ncbi:MAG: DUF362 domain-containing protein [Gemmatimonadetes bacterium]|nr:DUF362 domain-containing protein [Gemmatimonadota bacterium]
MTEDQRRIDRRRFLMGVAGGLACASATDVESLPGKPRAARSRVALVRTANRKEGVTRALALLDLSGARGARVVLKPNFNTADAAPASTHTDTLSQLVRELYEWGAREITLGESSGPPNTRSVMEQKGIFDLARDLHFAVVNYEEMPDREWVAFPGDGTHWADGFALPRLAVNAEYFVSTCNLKTHAYGGVFTMSLKLAVGLTPKAIRRPMHRSADMRRMIAELNLGYRPQLIVMDGVDAFVDGGPSEGELKHGNVVIAGTDRVAVDAVGIAVLKDLGANRAIMDRRIFEQEQIARAVELDLGIASTEEIELAASDEASRVYARRLEAILAEG